MSSVRTPQATSSTPTAPSAPLTSPEPEVHTSRCLQGIFSIRIPSPATASVHSVFWMQSWSRFSKMENFNTSFLKGLLSNLPATRQSATSGSSHKPICDFVPARGTGQKVTKMWSSLNITHLHQHPRGVRTRQNRKQQQKSLKLTIFPSMTLEKKPSQIPWSSISDHFLAYHWHSNKLKRNTGTKSNKPSPSSAPSLFLQSHSQCQSEHNQPWRMYMGMEGKNPSVMDGEMAGVQYK